MVTEELKTRFLGTKMSGVRENNCEGDLPWKERQTRGLHLGPTFIAVFRSSTHTMAPVDEGTDRTPWQ